MESISLFVNALASGLLLGAFYAAIACGLAIAFGILDIPNIAHPTVIVAAALFVSTLNSYGIDPLLAGILLAPPFFLAGIIFYKGYQLVFEARGAPDPLRSISLFFGVALLVEVSLAIGYGVDLRGVTAPYIGRSLVLGDIRLPYRMIIAFAGASAMLFGLHQLLMRTTTGRAIRAAGVDRQALRLVAIDPERICRIAFGVATCTAAIAGALLIIVGPVEPANSRMYIGRALAIVVLAGMGSINGTFLAALLVGLTESFVLFFLGASWAPAVSFALVLVVLAIRPQGIFRR